MKEREKLKKRNLDLQKIRNFESRYILEIEGCKI